jgi:hypothetical protein
VPAALLPDSEVSMKRALAFVLVVFSLVVTIPLQGASSEESKELAGALCQIHCSGVVGETFPRVSISVSHGSQAGELRETKLLAQLHVKTTAADVLALLADQLERAGAMVTRTEGKGSSSSLFVEDVVRVRIEDMADIQTTVTFCDRPLGILSLKRMRSAAPEVQGQLKIIGLLVDSDGMSREFKVLNVDVLSADTGHTVCKRLYESSLSEGWLPFRAQTDQWSPNRRKDSKEMESTEVGLFADGWALELTAG